MSQLKGKVILVSDPNQGAQAEVVIRRHLSNVQLVTAIWERGTPKDDARRIIRDNGPYWMMVSFNNDLVLHAMDLAPVKRVRVGLNGTSREVCAAYNIHPSLIPGMGYGTTPLYEALDSHGALAHLLELKPDTGPIFDAIECALPSTTNFRQLRLRNQLLALCLLDRTLRRIAQHSRWEDAHTEIAGLPQELNRPWSTRYVSIPERDDALRRLLAADPRHRVFDGMPMNNGIPLNGDPENVEQVPEELGDFESLFRTFAL